ncbi:MAG TPA: hypothetical protein VF071_10155 [Candidatus Limnocylindria bacterium]
MPDSTPGAPPFTAGPADEPALSDGRAIAERAADEAAADAERRRLAREPLPVLEQHPEQVFQVWPNEVIHVERRTALVERGQDIPPSVGTLYLTSRRLVHVGSEAVEEIELERISNLAVAQDRVLLIEVADGSDLAIEVDRPRLLRVQVAAAHAAMRERDA